MISKAYQHADSIRRSKRLLDVLEDKFGYSQAVSLLHMIQETKSMVLKEMKNNMLQWQHVTLNYYYNKLLLFQK